MELKQIINEIKGKQPNIKSVFFEDGELQKQR